MRGELWVIKLERGMWKATQNKNVIMKYRHREKGKEIIGCI